MHPGALSQPLILAAAQANNLSTSDMLRAVVVAYEIGHVLQELGRRPCQGFTHMVFLTLFALLLDMLLF